LSKIFELKIESVSVLGWPRTRGKLVDNNDFTKDINNKLLRVAIMAHNEQNPSLKIFLFHPISKLGL